MSVRILARAELCAVLLLAPCLAAQAEWRTGWWRGQRIIYQEINGQKLLDGDVLLEHVEDDMPLKAKAGDPRSALYIPASRYRWPAGVVPYVVAPDYPRPNEITEAIRLWETSTPIRFVRRTNEPNWIRFQTGAGCNSAVGMVGGQQVINLGPAGCGVPGTTHEIGHALGLHHEQQRADRDRYIFPNLDASNRHAYAVTFEPLFDWEVDGPFDYGSIMLYGRVIIGNPLPKLLLETIPAGIPAGGEVDGIAFISPSLANTVKRMYGAAPTETTIATVPPGRQVIVDGVSYVAPRNFNWAAGSTHTVEYPDGQISGAERYRFASWSDGGARAHTITITQLGQVYTAHATRELRLNLGTSANGRIAISPESPDGYYLQGWPVTLTAVPDSGYFFETFYGVTDQWWIGLGLGANPVTVIHWSKYAQPFAGFRPAGYRSTTVSANWPYVRIALDGVDYYGPISPSFWAPGSRHTISARDQPHWEETARYVFGGWTDGGPATRTVDADGGTYVASFRRQYRVTPIVGRGGSMSFSTAPQDGFFDEGTELLVSARPDPGYRFAGWARDLYSQATSATITVNRPMAIEALFVREGQSALIGPENLIFRTTAGSSPPPQQYFLAAATANTPFSMVTADPWVRVSASGQEAPATLTVSVNAQGFRPGKYRTPVRLLSPTAINSPKVLYVELWVEPPNCSITATPPANLVPAAGGMAMVQLTASDPNCNWTAATGSMQIRAAYTSGAGSLTLPVSFPANAGPRRTVQLAVEGARAALTQVGKPAELRPVSGANQGGWAGDTLPAPLIVELVDAARMPVPTARVELTATGASVVGIAYTDADGRISVPVTLGTAAGLARIRLRSAGVPDLEVTFSITLGPPQLASAGVVNAASLQPGPLAPDQLVAVLGLRFSEQTVVASSEALPTELGGVKVTLIDSDGSRSLAGVASVTPSQIRFLMPQGIPAGAARIRIERGDGQSVEAEIVVEPVAPGLFSANGNGTGVALAEALVLNPANGAQRALEFYRCPGAGAPCVPAALDYSPGEVLYLILYGTGFRHRSDLSKVRVEIGGQPATVLSAGPDPAQAGWDYLNIEAPASPRNQGLLDIRVTVDGRQTNVVRALWAPRGLVHRYSFSGDTRDSIQEAPMSLSQGAAVAAGSLILDGVSGHATLPPGILSNLSSCTLEAWVRWQDGGVWSRILDFGNGPGANLFLTPSNGANLAPRFAMTIGGAAAEQQITARSPLPRGVTTHVAVTIDSAGRTGTLFVDGVPVAVNPSLTLTPGALGRTTQNWLGRSQYQADPYFRGEISEFRIYDRALTEEEIRWNHDAGPDRLP